jgi:Tfp pilus assembly protein PilN
VSARPKGGMHLRERSSESERSMSMYIGGGVLLLILIILLLIILF